jgi:TonB-linked SusC/RagA family outer membrane protein
MLAFVFHASAKGFGQKKISIQVKNADISAILTNIEQRSDYRFLYNNNLAAIRQKTSLSVQDAEIKDVLDMLLKNTGLGYQLMENNLVVIKEDAGAAYDEIVIKGKVTNEAGNPMPGVSVQVKGAARGTTTDADGNYSIRVSDIAVLVFSYVGYDSQEFPVTGKTEINVKLEPSKKELDQVVVVGYGSQRKVNNTGSTVTVGGEAITRQPVVSVDQALQGKVAGLNVTNSGVPGAQATIHLRGINSVTGSTAPIYVVDGTITNDISYLNPGDIEKVDVLKDASSLAIFGVNAGNGAIMITTKKGRTGKARVSYSGYVGIDKVNKLIKMADASQYAQLSNEQARLSGNTTIPFPDSSLGAGTNWYKQVLRTALLHSHDVNISGGSEYNTYNFGAGFISQQGTVKETDYSKVTLRMNDEYKLSKHFKVGENIGLSRYEQNNPALSANVIKEAYNYDPTVVPFSNGKYGVSQFTNSGNPLADINYNNIDKLTGLRLVGNVYAEASFFDHFTFRSSFSLDHNNSTEKKYTPVYYVSGTQQNATSTLQQSEFQITNWFWNNVLTYDQTFGGIHHVTVTAGTEARETHIGNTVLTAKNVPNVSDATRYFRLGDPSTFQIQDNPVMNSVFSYIGRLNYALKDRYMLNATIRSDYASVYPSNNRNIVSPSIGAGWRISEESFMKSLKPVLSNLKLRYSWGRLPNANLPATTIPYTTIGTILPTEGNPTQPVFGGSLQPGISPTSVPNPNLTWEYTQESDFGLEAGFLNNKLTIEADYFIRKTKNLVMSVPIPAQSGPVNSQYVNAGTVQNKGFEFVANWRDNSHALKYSIGVNLATLQNKMLYVQGNNYIQGGSLGNGYLATITQQGLPIATYYGYEVIGVIQNQAQLNSVPHTSAARVGDFLYKDQNGDGKIDNSDRVPLGANIPKLTYGINATFSYHDFDLAIDLQGVYGNKVYNGNRSVRLAGYNFDEDSYLNRWHGEGTSNTYPAALNGSDSYAFPSSFFVESGSYFRIRNLQIGYNIPLKGAKKWGMSTLRVFASAQNLVTFFKYKGFNPEVIGVSVPSLANGLPSNSNDQAKNSGVDLSTYPLHTTYNFGINVGF